MKKGAKNRSNSHNEKGPVCQNGRVPGDKETERRRDLGTWRLGDLETGRPGDLKN
jgi:hypothetical protein